MSGLRDNWRIVLLVVLALASVVTLLVPGATVATGDNATAEGANASAAGITNLQYGIQLDGGSRIRAPIVGTTAENVDVQTVSLDGSAQGSVTVTLTNTSSSDAEGGFNYFVATVVDGEGDTGSSSGVVVLKYNETA